MISGDFKVESIKEINSIKLGDYNCELNLEYPEEINNRDSW